MREIGAPWVAAIVSLGLGLGLVGRAGAQTIEVAPPEQPPAVDPALLPPEVAPAPPAETRPGRTAEAAPAPPPESSAATPAAAAPAASAEAAAFGAQGHVAISLERAFGLDYISLTESSSGQDLSKTSATNFSLFGPPAAGAASLFSFPRLAGDFFLARDFSVGLGLGLLHGSASATAVAGGISTDQSSIGLLVMPRLGYAWHLAPDVALWAHAGISVVYLKAGSTNNSSYQYGSTQETSAHYAAVTVEAPIVFSLLPHLAFTAGPTLDITFDGHRTGPFVEAGNSSFDERVIELGLQAGLLIDL
jgi:hypothetical protein